MEVDSVAAHCKLKQKEREEEDGSVHNQQVSSSGQKHGHAGHSHQGCGRSEALPDSPSATCLWRTQCFPDPQWNGTGVWAKISPSAPCSRPGSSSFVSLPIQASKTVIGSPIAVFYWRHRASEM